VGFQGGNEKPAGLLKHRGLHLEIQIDASHNIGKIDRSHVKNVFLNEGVPAINDCEDSVAVVDATDKVQLYRNWFGLVRDALSGELVKGDKIFRALNADRDYRGRNGTTQR
jgi:malate synthase